MVEGEEEKKKEEAEEGEEAEKMRGKGNRDGFPDRGIAVARAEGECV